MLEELLADFVLIPLLRGVSRMPWVRCGTLELAGGLVFVIDRR